MYNNIINEGNPHPQYLFSVLHHTYHAIIMALLLIMALLSRIQTMKTVNGVPEYSGSFVSLQYMAAL